MGIRAYRTPSAIAGGNISAMPVASGRLSESVRFAPGVMNDGDVARHDVPDGVEMVEFVAYQNADELAILWVGIDDGSRNDIPEADEDLLAWLQEHGRPIIVPLKSPTNRFLRCEGGDELLLGLQGGIDLYTSWQMAS